MIKDILNWYKERFPERQNWTKAKHNRHLVRKLCEEVGELSQELIILGDIKDVGQEIADIMIILTILASQYNISIESAVKEKLKILKNRKIK